MSVKITTKLASAVGLAIFMSLGMPSISAQEMPPDGMGMEGEMGAPQAPPTDPGPKPKKPVPPAHLELDMGWLNERKQLEQYCDSILDIQFADVNKSNTPTDNVIVQQFREYLSDKYIVSEYQRLRPCDIDWSYPVPETTEDIKEIDDALTKKLRQEAEEQYPQKTRPEYIAEAKKLYRMHKKGDKVEIPLVKGGRGLKSKLRGTLKLVTADTIQLIPRTIVIRDDISDETAARYFPKVHDMMVKKYADEAELKCMLNRENYVTRERLKQLPEKLLAANYVPNHVDYAKEVEINIFKIEHWVSRRELVARQQRLLWEKNIGEGMLGERLHDAFLSRQGYVNISKKESAELGQALRQDEENRYVGWIPQEHHNMMKAWFVKLDQFKKEDAEYPAKLAKWEEDKRRWDDYQKGQAATSNDDDE